jgi:hypothetical protein
MNDMTCHELFKNPHSRSHSRRYAASVDISTKQDRAELVKNVHYYIKQNYSAISQRKDRRRCQQRRHYDRPVGDEQKATYCTVITQAT